jgi:hypothetical protein
MAKDSKDNLNPQIAAFAADLDAIRLEARAAETHMQGHHARTREALVQTYALGLKLIEQNLLEDFLKANVRPLTNRYKKNAFHDIVTLGFVEVREDSRSKYRKVLKFAQGEYWTAETFRANLTAETLDGLYLRALKGEDFDLDAKFEESAEDHFIRAKAALAKTSLGSVPVLDLNGDQPYQLDGFATAILRISNTSAEVVGFVPKEPDDIIEKRIASLVAIPAKRTRTKLVARALYEFFAICDVFKRCLPDMAELVERVAQAKEPTAINIPVGASGDEVAALIKARPKAAPTTLGDLEPPKHVMWLTTKPRDLSIIATMGTRLPAMIMMEAVLPLAKFPMAAHQLELTQGDVKRFFNEFMSEHTCRATHKTDGTTIDVNSIPQQSFEFSPAPAQNSTYRVLKTGAAAVAGFKLTKGIMSELEAWRDEFRVSNKKVLAKSFPKVLEFALDGTILALQFPNNPQQIRQLADVVVQGANFSTPGTHWYLETRYLERMILLAKDYGLDFDVSLLVTCPPEVPPI